jgi:hypothetical protein
VTALTLVPPKAPPPPKAFDHISYSAVSTFQTCPLRFFFRYILGLPVKTIASSLVFGSAMHKAVQYHFEQLLIGKPGCDVDTLLSVYHEYWEECEGQNVHFGVGEDRNTLGQMADRLLRIFIQSDFARPKGAIIGVEEQLRGQIIPGCPELLARVDLIVDAGDAVHISDFKTARCAWNDYKVEDVAPQLLLYGELVQPIADDRWPRKPAVNGTVATHAEPAIPAPRKRSSKREAVWPGLHCGGQSGAASLTRRRRQTFARSRRIRTRHRSSGTLRAPRTTAPCA